MHHLLQDLAVVMIVAALVTVVFRRLKQPVVLGYIIAGVIIGPHTPPFPLVTDEETIRTLSELGIIFLMFALGLEFNLRKLRQVGLTALLAAVLETLLMVWGGYELGRAFGWQPMDCLFLGAMLSVSSTTIIVKALAELGRSKEPFAGLIFGILVIEDIIAIVMIALLSGIAMTGSLSAGEVGATIGKLGIFLVTALVGGLIAVPRLLGYVGRFKSDEMLLVTVLGLCFGSSLLAVKLGYSAALGAFVVGAVVSEAREIGKVEHLVGPVRDMFSAIFFVSIGLLIEPAMIVEHALPIAVLTAAVVAGKVATCSVAAFVAGNDRQNSLRVGMGLAQIGEFSFIIASLGLSLGVTSKFLYPIGVAVSAITTLLTPYLIRGTDGLAAWFDRSAPRPLLDQLDVYTAWIGTLGSRRKTGFAAGLVRRWAAQIALNLALIAAVFLGAAYLGRHPQAWLPEVLRAPTGHRSVLWLAAVVLAMPMFVATFRKLQALGLLVAELAVAETAAGERTAAIRSIVAQAIPMTGLVALVLFGLALSSALLPPWKVLVVLLTVVALLTWLLWRTSVRLYSKAQIALEETLARPPERPDNGTPQVASLVLEADLASVAIADASPGARKLIRELALRTRTGASVVGIERAGSTVINPGPDEELLPGDQVLLLGNPAQLEAARTLFGCPPTDGAR